MTFASLFVRSCFRIYRIFAKVLCCLFHPFIKSIIEYRARSLKINFNGPEPDDIQVLSDEFYERIAIDWSLGFGEGYVDKLWTAKDIPGAIGKGMEYGSANKTLHPLGVLYGWFNLQTEGEDANASAEHYNFGNDWYESFLGESMQYTSGYWKNALTLDQAQFDKMELIAQKLRLKPGMRVADFGCGWGGLAIHLAKHYRVSVVCITHAVEHEKYIKEKIKGTTGLDIEIQACDFRKMRGGIFDRITAVGFTEHVGRKNYQTFYKMVNQLLAPDGLALIQVITRNAEVFKHGMEPFTNKYIFPNGWAPSHLEIVQAVRGYLTIQDWESFGQYYTKTLEAWRANLHKAWPKFQERYGERTFRIWDYYFSGGIALFKKRQFTVSHIVMSKAGLGAGVGYDYLR